MNLRFPPPTRDSLTLLIRVLQEAFPAVVSKDEASPRILLSDSNGQIWQVGITTTGAVTTTTISGKNRGDI